MLEKQRYQNFTKNCKVIMTSGVTSGGCLFDKALTEAEISGQERPYKWFVLGAATLPPGPDRLSCLRKTIRCKIPAACNMDTFWQPKTLVENLSFNSYVSRVAPSVVLKKNTATSSSLSVLLRIFAVAYDTKSAHLSDTFQAFFFNWCRPPLLATVCVPGPET